MSIYEYLHKDHEEIKSLMGEIKNLGPSHYDIEKQDYLFNILKKKLIIHSDAEEKSFYNPLKSYVKTKEDVEHGIEEHEEAETLLRELTDEALNGAAWHQKFLKLKEAVEHHIEEEEQDVFEGAKKVLSPEAEQKMEAEMKSLKHQLGSERDIDERHTV